MLCLNIPVLSGDKKASPSFPHRIFFLFSFSLFLLVSACRSQVKTPSLEEARQAWDKDDFQKAARLYEAYLAEQSTGPADQRRTARFELANTYFYNLRDFRAAVRQYSQLVAELGENARTEEAMQARQRLAEAYTHLGLRREAISEYESLLLFFPNLPNQRIIRKTVAELYYDQGDYDQSETEYRRVVEGVAYDAISEASYLRIASIDHRLRHKHTEAIATYQVLAEKSSQPEVRKEALLALADCQVQLMQYEAAMETLHQVPQITPEDKMEVRGRIKTIKKQRKELENRPEINWARKR
ncbi:MAG: tetratricopeptide repeat protein [Blastocatellia bacterium]|nr:tetratricopeptide repeat protein [Blastocatellia bacterium]